VNTTLRTIRKINASGDPVLGRLVAQWADNIERLTREWHDTGDLPWLYTERALLSVLAGAVWMRRGVAFEEYRSEKKALSGRRKVFSGREDIHFILGARGFKAEAKHYWAPATRVTSSSADTLRQKLQRAVDDVKNCPADGQERLGILFATLEIAKRYRHGLTPLIETWMHEVLAKVPCTGSAATFPESARDKCGPRGYDAAYPGCRDLHQEGVTSVRLCVRREPYLNHLVKRCAAASMPTLHPASVPVHGEIQKS
jgi:hypothetical protein